MMSVIERSIGPTCSRPERSSRTRSEVPHSETPLGGHNAQIDMGFFHCVPDPTFSPAEAT